MRINQKELRAYRQVHGMEIFSTPETSYDIVLAQFICEKRKKATHTFQVKEVAEKCGFDHKPVEEEDGFYYFLRPDGWRSVIELEHTLRELDLNKPLIFANGLLIDGHHRLYRAFMLGIDQLEGYILTPEEVQAI